MRLPAALAPILVTGLMVAACGGDEATPTPASDAATSAPAATSEAGATGGETASGASLAPVAEYGKKAEVTSEADPAATYALTSGRYRMQWSTTDCTQVDFVVSQVDGDFSFSKPSKSSFASTTINDLPEGSYTVTQGDPSCTEWTVRIDWMTN
jgi:hypothetical protein